ncbi:MAG TPA: MerR family transcriptional regulator [Bacillus sp. (in: firmicutes)]|nr:MerR family transcriptional regulator [Bacillus sp. (in: firmicutes)]
MEEIQYWKITDFAKELGKHLNTIDNWFKELERRRIHYVARASNEKVYDVLDLQIAKHIIRKREEKWALEAIFNDLPNHFDCRPFPLDFEEDLPSNREESMPNLHVIKSQMIEEVTAAVREVAVAEIQNAVSEIRSLKQSLDENQRLLLNLPSETAFKQQEEKLNETLAAVSEIRNLKQTWDEDRELLLELPKETAHRQRQERLDESLTIWRIEKQLEEEALEKWAEKPLEERMMKVGWFKKQEDLAKRDLFVKKYIREHFEIRFKQTFDSDESNS